MKIKFDNKVGGEDAYSFNSNDIVYIKLNEVSKKDEAELVIGFEKTELIFFGKYETLLDKYNDINSAFMSFGKQTNVISHHLGNNCISINPEHIRYVGFLDNGDGCVMIAFDYKNLKVVGPYDELLHLSKRLGLAVSKKDRT